MEASFQKLKSKVINHRNCKRFCSKSYQNEPVTEFSKQHLKKNTFEKFLEVCNKVLDNHASRKSKSLQDNDSPILSW